MSFKPAVSDYLCLGKLRRVGGIVRINLSLRVSERRARGQARDFDHGVAVPRPEVTFPVLRGKRHINRTLKRKKPEATRQNANNHAGNAVETNPFSQNVRI